MQPPPDTNRCCTSAPPLFDSRGLSASWWAATVVTPLPVTGEEFAWIRVNQVGYLPDDPKIAVLSSDGRSTGKFRVGDFAADIGADQGAWGPFAHNYRLDFTAVREAGRVSSDVRRDRVAAIRHRRRTPTRTCPAKLLEFMRLQRCGDNPVTGKKCHQHDAFDADDRRDARHGRRLARRGRPAQAHDHHVVLRGGAVPGRRGGRGAPRGARCVEEDSSAPGRDLRADRRRPRPPAAERRCGTTTNRTTAAAPAGRGRRGGPPGSPRGRSTRTSPTGVANLAGRSAAAMALAGDVDTARSLYGLAKSKPGNAMSVPVRAPYYYGESSYLDDLEWAATELFIATKDDAVSATTRSSYARASRRAIRGWAAIGTGTTSSSRT